MKKIVLVVSISLVLALVGYFVYEGYIFKHEVNIEEIISFKVTGKEGSVNKELVIQEGLNPEVINFIYSLTYDYAPIVNAKHDTTIEVPYSYDKKLLEKYRIKVDPTNDGMLAVEVGHLDHYIRNHDEYTDELKGRVNELLSPKYEAERQTIRDEIACAPCSITITQEDDPIVLDTWYYEDVTLLEAKLIKYRYHVSTPRGPGYFDQYLLVYDQNIYVKENAVVEIADRDAVVNTLAFASNLEPKSDQQVMNDFRTILEKYKAK